MESKLLAGFDAILSTVHCAACVEFCRTNLYVTELLSQIPQPPVAETAKPPAFKIIGLLFGIVAAESA